MAFSDNISLITLLNESDHEPEDIVVAVKPSTSVGTDVEYLRELEFVLVVHHETARDEDEHAVGDGSWLHILIVDLVYDLLEAEGFNLVLDLLAPNECLASIGHGAIVQVEVNQSNPISHQGCVVLNNKLVGD